MEVDSGVDAGADAGFDAGTWVWERAGAAIPSRSVHCAFPVGNDIWVMSGNHGSGPLQDLWSWNGTEWNALQHPGAACPERKNPGMGVDLDGGRVFITAGVWSGYPADGGSYTVRMLDDLCVFDGTTWTNVKPTVRPTGRAGQAAAWDPAHQALVVFGGTNNSTPYDDTWLFKDGAWIQATPSEKPSPRINARMAYDAHRGVMVLFGGMRSMGSTVMNYDETWEWDGTNWHEVTVTGPTPPGRGFFAMDYDPVHQRVVISGGSQQFPPIDPGHSLGDSWAFDGTSWTELLPVGPSPVPRSGSSLTWHAGRQRFVFFGGGDPDFGDIWEWDGASTWTERTPQPPARSSAAFAQQHDGDRAVFFGGYVSAGGFLLGDTWEWNGTSWKGWPAQTGGPEIRTGAAMAMHGTTAVLFGGQSDNGYLSDTWTLAAGATSWTRVNATTPPEGRTHATMVYDPEHHVTLMYGGKDGSGRKGDTWRFDGTQWAKVNTSVSPGPRDYARLLFNPVTKKVVLLSGTNGTILNDAWVFDGTNWDYLPGVTGPETAALYSAHAYDAQGRLFVVGGLDRNGIKNDAWVLDASGWKKVTGTPPVARFSPELLRVGTGWRVITGSTSDFQTSWEDLTDVWTIANH